MQSNPEGSKRVNPVGDDYECADVFEAVKKQTPESYNMLYKLCEIRIRMFLIKFQWYSKILDATCGSITSDMYISILSGKFEDKKFSFDTFLRNEIFQCIAEETGINDNALRRVCRVKKICREYNIEPVHKNAVLIMECACTDGKYPLGLTEVHHAIDNIAYLTETKYCAVPYNVLSEQSMSRYHEENSM